MDPDELEIWTELKPGKAVRVRMSVFEEGLPSPGESDRTREPTVREFLAAVHQLSAGNVTLGKPF